MASICLKLERSEEDKVRDKVQSSSSQPCQTSKNDC